MGSVDNTKDSVFWDYCSMWLMHVLNLVLDGGFWVIKVKFLEMWRRKGSQGSLNLEIGKLFFFFLGRSQRVNILGFAGQMVSTNYLTLPSSHKSSHGDT